LDRVPQLLRLAGSWIAGRLPYRAYGKNYLHMITRPSGIDRYFAFNYAPYHMRSRLLRNEWMLHGDTPFVPPADADTLAQVMYFETSANLIGDMLVKVDRMSMAASLEVRCPLLDHELAELAATIPHDWKIANGRGKNILIDALGDRLPPELLTRPKWGFGVPLDSWFRGSLREFLWDHLDTSRFLDLGIVDPGFLRALLTEHDTGRRDNSHWLFSLLILALWFDDRSVPACPAPALS